MQLMSSRITSGFLIALTALSLPNFVMAQGGDAAKVFKANCALCHSADGSGASATGKAMKAKDLRSDEVQKQSDAELTEAIAKGKGKMPAFGSKLSPDATKSVVSYVRELAKK